MANEKTTTLAPAAETQPKPNQTKPKRRAKPAGQGKKVEKKEVEAPVSKKKPEKKASSQGKGKSRFGPRPAAAKPRGKDVAAKAIRKDGKDQPVRIYFLGGLNEIGKNMTLYECGDDMFIVDCGLAFPDEDMLGVDLVIPDFTFVERNKNKIRGIVLTHGHEDHIGSLPFLLKKFNVPLYGTQLTLGLVAGKLREHGLLNKTKLNVCAPGQVIKLGCFSIELIHVNHSIPGAVAFAITTPAGVIIQTGDFKIDCTPIHGEMIDLGRFGEYGRKGVLALLMDSTNAERPGYTKSERSVGESFDVLFKRAEHRRIVIATFASNIHRVQQIIDAAARYGRKVALSGRSMVNVASVGMELGYLKVPDGIIVDLDQINHYPKEKIVLITTGSQGEPMSALTRMAFSDHRKVAVGPEDFIIISATPIPGNEKTVGKVVNELLKLGADVIYERMYDVHVSGHACQEELKLMQALTRPKYFIPVHGEQKHLRKHAGLAMAMGMPRENIFIGDIGNVLELHEDHMRQLGNVPAGEVMVDGLGVGDVGSIVLRDRKHLAQDGLIIVVVAMDSATGEVVSGPDIVSRGFVYVREAEDMMSDARRVCLRAVDRCREQEVQDWGSIKNAIKDQLGQFVWGRTKRSPMILPIIQEV